MKVIQIIFLFFIIYNCYCNLSCSKGNYHTIDNNHADYNYDIELDWTDDDEKTIKVPFTNLVNKDEIIPIFVNGTSLDFYEGTSCTTEEQINNIKRPDNLYSTHNIISDHSVNNGILEMTLKADGFKANNNDVKKKYIKYFCWYECDGDNKSKFRESGIIVVVNNSGFMKFSKYLIGLLLLFL